LRLGGSWEAQRTRKVVEGDWPQSKSVELFSTFRDYIKERSCLVVDEVDVGRKHAARRSMSRHGTGPDRHHLHVTDILGRVLRLPLGIEQVLGAEQDQRLRLDRL